MRLAVALLAGQAALCAVIGWVTFGPPTGPSPQQAADPLAAPRLAMPTASVAMPPPPAPATRAPASPAAGPAKAARTTRSPAREQDERAGAVDEPTTMIAPATTPPSEPPAPSPDEASTPPAPTATDDVQGPVVEGEPCEPENALGVTADGVSLRCVRQEDGGLVWQLN